MYIAYIIYLLIYVYFQLVSKCYFDIFSIGTLIDCHPLFTSFLFLDKKGENIAFIVFNPFIDSLFRTKRGRRIYCFIFTWTPLLMIDKKGEKYLSLYACFICMFCFYLLVCRLIGIKSMFVLCL